VLILPQVKRPHVIAVLFATVGEAPINEHGGVVESRGAVKSPLRRDLVIVVGVYTRHERQKIMGRREGLTEVNMRGRK
jgi:hypothetical protein